MDEQPRQPTKIARAMSYYRRGRYYYEHGQWREAMNNLRDAIYLYPEHVLARLYMGAAMAQEKLYLEAIELLEECRQWPCLDEIARRQVTFLLGTVCMMRRDFPAAIYYLKLIGDADEGAVGDPEKVEQLSYALCRAGEFDEGLRLYLRSARAASGAAT